MADPDGSEAVLEALRQLQEGYADACSSVQQLQEEKAALKADARSMAEHLYAELSASQERVAELTVQTEHLRELQVQLAAAAAEDADRRQRELAAAQASEAAALRKVAALEAQLARLQQAAHQLELEQQDGRVRRQVAAEELGCQVEQLRLQLEAARAGAAAQQDVADLWQRKHAQLEGRVADMEVQLERERQGREQAETAMAEAQGRAAEAEAEARVFKQASASTLKDLSKLCSALKTAQAAMAADSSSNPAYSRALSIIEASLQRVAASSEKALSAVASAQAAAAGAHAASSGQGGGEGAGPLQQQVRSLLLGGRLPAALACSVGAAEDQQEGCLEQEFSAAARSPASMTAVAISAGATAKSPRLAGTPPQAKGLPPATGSAAAAAAAAPAGQGRQAPGQQMLAPGRVLRELAAELAPRQGSPLPAAASTGKAAGGPGLLVQEQRGREMGGPGSMQPPSPFIQAFRAQHGRAGAGSPLPRTAEHGSSHGSAAVPQLAVPASPAALPTHRLPAEGLRNSSASRSPSPVPPATMGPAGTALQAAARAQPARRAQPLPGPPPSASLAAVIMAVEDELATLDIRHAALLKQSRQLGESKALPGDITLELQREELAGVVVGVREAMQRKGEQLRQLQQYRDMLA